MNDEISKRQVERFAVLSYVYDRIEGALYRRVLLSDIENALGLQRTALNDTINFLKSQDLLGIVTTSDLTLSASGVSYVEQRHLSGTWQKFSPTVNINIGAIHHQNVTGDKNVVSQTSTYFHNEYAKLDVVLEEMLKSLNTLRGAPSQLEQLNADIRSILSQTRAPNPNKSVVTTLLAGITSTLKFIGGAVAEGYIQKLVGLQ